MVFSTPLFLFYYLTAVLAVYYVLPVRFRNFVLLIASLFFYYWGEQAYTVIMLLSIAIDYTHGWIVHRCKERGNDRGARLAVASSMIFNLGILFFFKYWDFAARSLQAVGLGFLPVLNISLPIGISFYTFQTMSYTVDVYRGDSRVQKNVIHFGAFVTLFPQLIAGPIIKYKDLDEQLDSRTHSLDRFASGVERFLVGLAKKLLLANNLGQLWDVFKAMPGERLTLLGAWLGVTAFAFQIYFDFNAGFTAGIPWLKVNPNYPHLNVAQQERDDHSVLNYYKRLLALRKSEGYRELFTYGDFTPLFETEENILAYRRNLEGKDVIVVANFGQMKCCLRNDMFRNRRVLLSNENVILKDDTLKLQTAQVVVLA